MTEFLELASSKKLQKLAKKPPDLTDSKVFTFERIQSYRQKEGPIDLLYAGERVDADILSSLWHLADERDAIPKMVAMQDGAVMNQIEGALSEKRSVLHTATRDQFDNPNSSLVAQEARLQALKELTKLREFLSQLDDHFTDIVQIGIGGSDLGPRALYLSLQPYRQKRRLHFISNVDPDDAASVLQAIDYSHTLFVVVSKSGTTLETLTNEEIVRASLIKKHLSPEKHLIAVTGEKSPMDDPKRYKIVFYMWDYVGGRYSSTSMVGAVTLSFVYGIDVFMDILRGAHAMDRHALTPKNTILLSALLGIWNRTFLNHSTLAIIPYSQALIRFPAHIQQLDMESNGKSIDKQGQFIEYAAGPVIWGDIGTNAQHSFFQLIHQGRDIVPVEFIAFHECQSNLDSLVKGTTSQEKLLANLYAQSIALSTGQKSQNPNKYFSGNRPNHILFCKRLDPFTLGALLAFYEHKVAFQGFIWNINSFDQEGVQLGKVLSNQILDLYSAKRERKTLPHPFRLGEGYISTF